MSYIQTGLQGSGTPEDPFILNSYADWKIIDAGYTGAGDVPPHYKLMNDIDMYAEHELFEGKDFLLGTLHMNNHSIMNAKLKPEGFAIRNCTVIGGPLEILKGNGKVSQVGGEGKITNMTGTQVAMIFANCYFERVFLDIDATNMWFNNFASLTGQIAGLQCYIRIKNEGINNAPLIGCKRMDERASFKDCCFEFNGNAFSYSFIEQTYISMGIDVILDHCMVCGSVDCYDMLYKYDSQEAPYVIRGGVRSCAFDIYAKNSRDERGWKEYAMLYDMQSGPSIAVSRKDLYVGGIIERVTPSEFRNPDILASKGFDVYKTR